MSGERAKTITRNTLIPVGLVCSLLGTVAWVANDRAALRADVEVAKLENVRQAALLADNQHNHEAIETRLARLETQFGFIEQSLKRIEGHLTVSTYGDSASNVRGAQ